MKSNLFTFLREKKSFGRDDLDEIKYYSFVEQHKLPFIKKYCSQFKILNKKNRETMVYRHYFRQR